MRLPVKSFTPLAFLVLLTSCGGGDGRVSGSPVAALPGNGPAADYPVVLGEPFTISGVTYTPVDKLSYDSVGYASIGGEGGSAVSAAHKTLPLPSYVEITALDSGKTVLVRLERRGPMTNDRLVELSPGAATQLGLDGQAKAPVRVRRVNPTEPERALLRAGERAPDRMDTPKPLLAVLMRKLDPQAPAAAIAPVASASAAPTPKPAPKPANTPVAEAPRPTPSGSLFVQVGAYASRSNAEASAAKVGGRVEPAGRLFRVRTGPFANRAEAEASLAKARAAGYRDARIQRAD